MTKLKRIYHRCESWEEMHFNMWGKVGDRKEWLQRAIEFTGDHKLYGSFMMRVIREWPISCENSLTASSGRKAWLGHAAVALALHCPEDIVRQAWGHLSDEQRFLANEEARRAIAIWEDGFRKDHNLCPDMGIEMLPGWDS